MIPVCLFMLNHLRKKTKNSDNKKSKSIGIHNLGKNNTFIDNKFTGLDIGILDEGEKSKAFNNKFSK